MKKTIKYILIVLYVFWIFYDTAQAVEFGFQLLIAFVVFKIVWSFLDALFFWRIREHFQRKKDAARAARMLEENKAYGIELGRRFDAPITNCYNYSHCGYVLVSEPKNLVMINESIYNFTQIVGCDLIDNATQNIPEMTVKTTTDTGSMLSRAFVGGLIGGDSGRIIGGATASRTTKISGGIITTNHDYRLSLRLDSLACPIVTLRIGGDEWLANQLHGTFKLISERGQKLREG